MQPSSETSDQERAERQIERCLEAAADGFAKISRGTLLDIQAGFAAVRAGQPASEPKRDEEKPEDAWKRCANESLKIYLHAFEQNAVVEDALYAIRRLADAYEPPKGAK